MVDTQNVQGERSLASTQQYDYTYSADTALIHMLTLFKKMSPHTELNLESRT